MPKAKAGKKIKLVIAGSRKLTDYALIDKAIDFARLDRELITEVISGGAKGVDTSAKAWAENNGVPFKEFPALWKDLKAKPCSVGSNQYGEYNKMAGFNRNRQMADYGDILLAVWHEGARGTEHMIEEMKCRNKPVYVLELEI